MFSNEDLPETVGTPKDDVCELECRETDLAVFPGQLFQEEVGNERNAARIRSEMGAEIGMDSLDSFLFPFSPEHVLDLSHFPSLII